MDLVETCKTDLERKILEIDELLEKQDEEVYQDDYLPRTQNGIAATIFAGKDTNLDKILSQQTHLKTLIDRDGQIKLLRKTIADCNRITEQLRQECSQITNNAMKNRQDETQTHSKDLERFQMQQLRNIAEDYRRHKDILEQRKKEIVELQREIKDEESNREAHLIKFEKNLEARYQERQKAKQIGDTSRANDGGLTDELHVPDSIELTSVDEYAPYGTAPHSRVDSNAPNKRGRGRGRRRGSSTSKASR